MEVKKSGVERVEWGGLKWIQFRILRVRWVAMFVQFMGCAVLNVTTNSRCVGIHESQVVKHHVFRERLQAVCGFLKMAWEI